MKSTPLTNVHNCAPCVLSQTSPHNAHAVHGTSLASACMPGRNMQAACPAPDALWALPPPCGPRCFFQRCSVTSLHTKSLRSGATGGAYSSKARHAFHGQHRHGPDGPLQGSPGCHQPSGCSHCQGSAAQGTRGRPQQRSQACRLPSPAGGAGEAPRGGAGGLCCGAGSGLVARGAGRADAPGGHGGRQAGPPGPAAGLVGAAAGLPASTQLQLCLPRCCPACTPCTRGCSSPSQRSLPLQGSRLPLDSATWSLSGSGCPVGPPPCCRLGEADLRQRGESDVEEHSQAEVVAAEEASRQGLDREHLNVQAWCVVREGQAIPGGNCCRQSPTAPPPRLAREDVAQGSPVGQSGGRLPTARQLASRPSALHCWAGAGHKQLLPSFLQRCAVLCPPPGQRTPQGCAPGVCGIAPGLRAHVLHSACLLPLGPPQAGL